MQSMAVTLANLHHFLAEGIMTPLSEPLLQADCLRFLLQFFYSTEYLLLWFAILKNKYVKQYIQMNTITSKGHRNQICEVLRGPFSASMEI